jgi:hypothetical protein
VCCCSCVEAQPRRPEQRIAQPRRSKQIASRQPLASQQSPPSRRAPQQAASAPIVYKSYCVKNGMSRGVAVRSSGLRLRLAGERRLRLRRRNRSRLEAVPAEQTSPRDRRGGCSDHGRIGGLSNRHGHVTRRASRMPCRRSDGRCRCSPGCEITLSGGIPRGERDCYTLGARQGQILKVEQSNKPDANIVFQIYQPPWRIVHRFPDLPASLEDRRLSRPDGGRRHDAARNRGRRLRPAIICSSSGRVGAVARTACGRRSTRSGEAVTFSRQILVHPALRSCQAARQGPARMC